MHCINFGKLSVTVSSVVQRFRTSPKQNQMELGTMSTTTTSNNSVIADDIVSETESWARWRPTSASLLQQAEEKILSSVKAKFESMFVRINDEDKLRTLKFNPAQADASDKIPVVLVHGFASGVALWALNFDALSQNRPLYAFDLLGFGRSSRPPIPQDPDSAETEFVDSIESWRSKVGIEKMILVGHSFGGFLTYAYSIRHPDRVKHLVLADPWGVPEKPPPEELQFPLWLRAIGAVVMKFNPLSSIRAAGPLGPGLLRRIRGDLNKKFYKLFEPVKDDRVSNYIYHCNAQEPSGEMAFKSMSDTIGWAVNPIVKRSDQLASYVPITMIYGDESWMDRTAGADLQYRRRNSYIKMHVLTDAGHHVYADKSEEFNRIVSQVADEVD